MSSLSEARQAIAATLAAALEGTGTTSLDHVPEELPSPAVIIDAAEDYLTLGDTYDDSQWWLTLRVLVLVDLTANEQATADLEDALQHVLPTLAASEWELSPIGRPGPWRTTQWLAHGVAITIRTLVTITGETP